MTPSLRRIGAHASPIVVIDNFSGDPAGIVAVASAMAPFPRAEGSYYPGLRRRLSREDCAAWAYVEHAVRTVAPFIGRGFGIDEFDLLEASFSIVTQPPGALAPLQRIPHFDSINPKYLAILHYLGGTEGTGTAFYRQRSTGIERVDSNNRAAFISAALAECEEAGGYIGSSDDRFDQIAFLPASPDRLVIYQGALLHSGVMSADMPYSPNPTTGRLTANLFIQNSSKSLQV